MRNFLVLTFLTIFITKPLFAQKIPDRKFKNSNEFVFGANGYVNLSGALQKQNSSFDNNILPDGLSNNYLNSDFSIGSDSQIFLEGSAKNKNNSKYGAIAKFEFNFNSNGRKENLNLDQNFLFFDGDFGKFELGNNIAANQFMKEGSQRVTKGAGGVNGKYLEHVNLPMLGNSSGVCSGGVLGSNCSKIKLSKFILLSQSPVGHGGSAKGFYSRQGDNLYKSASRDYSDFNRSNFRSIKDNSFDGVEDATKLTYYTPRVSGFKLGLSYAPSSKSNGLTKNTALDVDQTVMKNIFSGSISYLEDFDNLFLAISAGAEKANAKNSRSNSSVERADLLAYDLGLTASYFGVSLGLSYGIWKDYLQAKNGAYSCDYNPSLTLAAQNCSQNVKKFSKPYYASAALSYEFGPFGTSLSALKSEFEKNKYYAISFDLDYKISKNVKTYFEATRFAFNSNQPTASDISNQDSIANSQRQLQNNRGYVFLTGILFSF